MGKETVARKIAALRQQLHHHNHLYYIEARPEVSDREYDRLMRELIDLESLHPELISPDSPSQRVGGEALEALASVRHSVPMMSIDNTYSEAEVRAFDERVKKRLAEESAGTPAYVLEPKIDGTAISLRYENGVLVLAATRGRGNVGDDITANARTIRSVPLNLQRADGHAWPAIMEVRGEVYMANDDFQRVNREIEEAGEEPYKNPRNLTAGTLRRLEPKVVAQRRLRFLAHGLGQVEPLPAASYWEWIKLLRGWGLPLPEHVSRVESVDEAIKLIEQFNQARRSLPYMTDGMVMKVDSFAQRDLLGATSKAPRWVIAFKYETEQQPTELKDVRWQVGKGGNLTPVGDLEPVYIGGVTVSHVTLHNIEQIRRLDLHLGDTIVVERSGEVIPYVVDVLRQKRPRGAKAVEPPAHCPSCGSKVEKEDGTPILRCANPACPAQFKERLRWFCGRSQMDIDGLGEKLLEQLIHAGKLKDYSDLYHLNIEDIANLMHEVRHKDTVVLARTGEKVAERIVKSLEESKHRTLDRVLGGLAIPHVGTTVARELATAFDGIDALLNASEGEIREAIDQSGDKDKQASAITNGQKLYDFLHDRARNDAAQMPIASALDTLDPEVLRHVFQKHGIKIAKQFLHNLLDRFTTVEQLLSASPEQLSDAMIGRVVAHSLFVFLHSDAGTQIVRGLRAAGVEMKGLSRPSGLTVGSQNAFAGKRIVITGSFSAFSRDQLRERLILLGAKVIGSVSTKTDLLLCGSDPGSKRVEAEKLKIVIWDEDRLNRELAKVEASK